MLRLFQFYNKKYEILNRNEKRHKNINWEMSGSNVSYDDYNNIPCKLEI